MTRTEHIRWCKERARYYLPDDPANAVASMLSDLSKHPDTAKLGEMMGPIGLLAAMDSREAARFVEGFTE